MSTVRKGQAPAPLARNEFQIRFMQSFYDPAYQAEQEALRRLEEIAFQAYSEGRKAPRTQKAGPEFADPDYDLSIEWRATRDKLIAAQKRWGETATGSRVLLVCGSSRNDGTCPGEISKTFRLVQLAKEVLEQAAIEVDVLDLSLLASSYDLHLHPCKGCVSKAMPLCHWPGSCVTGWRTPTSAGWPPRGDT